MLSSSPENPTRPVPPANHHSRPPEADPRSQQPTATFSPRSYSSALIGTTSSDTAPPQSWICVGEHDIVPVRSNGVRALRLSKEFKDKLCKPWTNTVVIRLIGKSVGYSYLCNRLRSMWKPTGNMHVIDVGLNCFLVRFGDEKDYFKALTGGPWIILDHYLVVQQWDPTFRVSDKLPSKMVVWVRFPHIPIQLYHKQILTSLGNLIEKTVRVDYNTQTAERGKFARIAVEIDLNEPLATGIDLDGAWQRVEYENLPDLCFSCGKVGHRKESCPSLSPQAPTPVLATASTAVPESSPPPLSGVEPTDGYGPWLTVTRKSRRDRRGISTDKEGSPKRKVESPHARSKAGVSTGKDNYGSSKDSGEETSTGKSHKEEDHPQTVTASNGKESGPAKKQTPLSQSKGSGPKQGKGKAHANVVSSSAKSHGPSGPSRPATKPASPPSDPMATDVGALTVSNSAPFPPSPPGNLFAGLLPTPNPISPPLPSPPTFRQRDNFHRSKAAARSTKLPPSRKSTKTPGKKKVIDKSAERLLAHEVLQNEKKKPKSQGGLGLKKAKELNEAYMMKMGWHMLTSPDKLWVRILTSKYLKSTNEGMQIRRKTGGSNLWKGFRRTWSTMASACQHSIRDGKSTLFWQHRWLDSGDRLADWALGTIDNTEMNRTVAEMVTDDGNWNWSLLTSLLPPGQLEHIAGMGTPNSNCGEDNMIWGPDPQGKFSISSAYEIITSTQNNSDETLWKRVWKWQGPNRVKHFLWLVAHNRLLTNVERKRRHMTDEDSCRLCPSTAEDSLHILRDCKAAVSFWKAFLPPSIVAPFFSGNLQDWLSNFICDPDLGLAFGIGLWLLWKARNEDIFEGKPVTSAQLRLRVHSWIAGVRETMKSSSQILSEIVGRRRDTLIKWIPAPDEWVTINTDGSVIQPQSFAAGGGVIRNSHGAKLAAFAANFGRSSIMRAELRAAAVGLSMAWDLGFRQVNLQLDSLAALAAIRGSSDTGGRHGHIIHMIRDLCSRDWTVNLTHTYREGNRVADLLAHLGHSLAFGSHFITDCNPDIRMALLADCIGVSFPRTLSNNT
ncbi:Putative ribonuclease H protein At1g65750 [Linum perenne]